MFNDPVAFKEEMTEGFVAAYNRYLRRVPEASGVMATGAPVPGQVALVIGGGAGHYPAFCGLVGDGLATGAVIGDVFTSPSGEQVYRVARAVDGGAGIIFSFGNYGGDVMNFGMAETRLRAEEIDARTVLVTDDVLSAPKAEAEKRRGTAGTLYVFKTGGASAARGDDIATVEGLMRRANDRVRTASVAFAGCTIPGQMEPLFTVDPGQMEVGLGIHGEPGVRSTERLPAREIAHLLVEALLVDAPPDAGSQAAVLVNGLGATKYEELFVLYQGVAPLLARAGIETYEPLVGEFVTSLDMAGCSLTLFWLDDELRALHDATAVTPAFTRIGPEEGEGGKAARRQGVNLEIGSSPPSRFPASAPPRGTPGRMGELARAGVAAALDAILEAEEELGRLDANTGDGDHGAGMARGFRAAVTAVDGVAGTARETLTRAGIAFTDAAGGASGVLVGGWLMALGAALPDNDDEIDAVATSKALESGLAAVQRLGQARAGDKTLVDALEPFARTFEEAVVSGFSIADAWTAALSAAEAGMHSTTGMVSQRGRASRLGERSRGFQDAGATSMFYVLRAFGGVLEDEDE